VQHLLDRLTTIQSRIEQRQTRKGILKGITILRLYGSSDKDDFLVALQEYQSRAALIGSLAVSNVLSKADRGDITSEFETALLSITSALTALGCNMTQTENQLRSIKTAIELVDGKIGASLTHLLEINSEVKRSNDALCNLKATFQNAMKEELTLFRERLPLCDFLVTPGQLDRGDLEIDLGCMKGYLESIVQGNGWPSDLDIWECIWDVKETVHLLGPSVSKFARSGLDETGTVGVKISGENYIVHFSPMISLLSSSLGTLLKLPNTDWCGRIV